MTRPLDLIGRVFGRLTVMGRTENNKFHKVQWLCRCSCGKEKIVLGALLVLGKAQSCRCLHNELLRKRCSGKPISYYWKNKNAKRTYYSGSAHPQYGKHGENAAQREMIALAPEYLAQKYIAEKVSCSAIAQESGWSEELVRKYLLRYGIPARTLSEARALRGPVVTRVKMSSWWVGKKHSPAAIEKMRAFQQNAYHPTGPDSSRWKGGITPIAKKIRNSQANREWKTAIFERDRYECQKCGKRGNRFQVHHIENFSSIFDTDDRLLFDTDNGIAFCKDCHALFHHLYGKKNNSQEQILDYLQQPLMEVI